MHNYVSYVTEQGKYNLLDKAECEMMGLCQEEKIGMLSYVPLAKGFIIRNIIEKY